MASNAQHGLKMNAWISDDGGTTYNIITETRALELSVENDINPITPHTTTGGVVVEESIPGVQRWTASIDANLVQTETALDALETAALNQTTIKFRFARQVGTGLKMVTGDAGVRRYTYTGPDNAEQRARFELYSRSVLTPGTQA